jgi:hypothetical protein
MPGPQKRYQTRPRMRTAFVNALLIEILDLEQVCMLAQALQIFLGKEHLVKNRLISTLDKVFYYKGTFLQGSTKPLFSTQNRLETS